MGGAYVDYEKLSRKLSDKEFEEILTSVREARKLRETFPPSKEHEVRMKAMREDDWEMQLQDMGYSS